MKREIKQILEYTAIAPSSHNTQPWFVSVKDDIIYLHVDSSRGLKHSDPENRELYISLGASLQNTLYAVSNLGFKYSSEYFPGKNEKIVAAISVNTTRKRNSFRPMLDAMRRRHSNRNNYEDKVIPKKVIDNWSSLIDDLNIELNIIGDIGKRAEIAEVVADATKEAMSNKEFRNELSQWLRHNFTSAHDGMPGYGMNMPAVISFFSPLVIKNFNVGASQSKLEKRWITSSPVVVIISGNDSILDWVKAGQAYERIVLDATTRGIRSATMAAAIETGQNYKKLMRILNSKKRPLVMFRLGYCEKVPKPTPKRTVEEIIRN
jgi:glycerol-3-phosphate cytidylyltransferase-like family protein